MFANKIFIARIGYGHGPELTFESTESTSLEAEVLARIDPEGSSVRRVGEGDKLHFVLFAKASKATGYILCALPDDEARAIDFITYILRETLPGVYAEVNTLHREAKGA